MKTMVCMAGISALAVIVWQRAPAEAAPTESYCGMCDASAVMAVNENLFVVADDEDSVMRAYSRGQGEAAVFRINLAPFLGFGAKAEADFEGAARLGDLVYWITSHGNNRKGKEQESRQRFFAVRVNTGAGGVSIQPQGRPYTRLLDDLLAEPKLASFQLATAATRPPKEPGALNIEGLAATPEGHLLIGFRNPIPRGRALIVPLLNPAEVIAGQRARFGDPMLLDLGKYGIRSIEQWRGAYLIVAGSADGAGKSRLYHWNGKDAPSLLPEMDFSGLNPEAISIIDHGNNAELLVVSDDGTRKINGVECKKLKDPMQKKFRAVSVPLSNALAAHQSTP